LQYLVVPEAHDFESLLCQPSVTHWVIRVVIVLPAIRLDDHAGTKVHEVHHIGADWLLAAELPTIEAMGPQMSP
jgi:hypothetical protein